MILPSTITSKGQVTIPLPFRQMFNFRPGQKVEFMVKNEPKELVLKLVMDFSKMMGILKTKKKYSKAAARRAYMKDLLAGRI